jgi:glycosyltransferase involved in cell wall biosynthesis
MNIDGLVTTIIPVLNRPTFLREAVASVLAQTYRPIEIIIVDDGSTDSTPAVIAELRAKYADLVRVADGLGSGPGGAREAGRRLATGEFIQYLDSDDLLSPEKFQLQVAGLRECAQCDIAYGHTLYQEVDGRPAQRPWKRTGEMITTLFPSMLAERWWGTSTPLYRRSLTDKGGAWSNLRCEEDWEYDCRLAIGGVELCYCPVWVSTTRSHTGSRLSQNGSFDAEKLADRAKAHELILGHARKGGILSEASEMRRFARELFLLSRQCGAAGLETQSRNLFFLAREASCPRDRRGLDFYIYEIAAKTVGWKVAGKLACRLDEFRQ